LAKKYQESGIGSYYRPVYLYPVILILSHPATPPVSNMFVMHGMIVPCKKPDPAGRLLSAGTRTR